MRNILFLVIVVVFLCGCQQTNEIIITQKNGVDSILNPDTPVQNNIIQLHFEEIFRLGTNINNENEIFQGITYLHVNKNHQLFVAEKGNNRVQQFDKNGNFLRILGRGGQGPGEYMFPTTIFTGPLGEIIVLDEMIGKLIYYDQDGGILKDDRLRDEIQKRFARPQFIDAQKIIFSVSNHNPDPKNLINVIEIYSFDLSSRELKELLRLNVAREVITGESGAWIDRNKWISNIAVSPEGELFIANGMDFKIEVYNKHGQKLREITRKYNTVSLSAEEKRSSKGSASVGSKTFSPPDQHADIQALFFVVPGECWVITSHKEEEERRIIDVLDEKGRFVRQLSVNIPINLKRSFGNLRVQLLMDESSQSIFLYQAEKNEDDVEQVVCYRANYKYAR